MRTTGKVLIWVVVFVGAAGIGAYIAAHSNPFPPIVETSPRRSASGGPSTASQPLWKGTIRSASYHQLYVGGRCTTDWRGTIEVTLRDDGNVEGTGTVRRIGALRCDFPTAQAQVANLDLAVRGSATARRLAVHLVETSSTPSSGADEYGGFLRTVLAPGPGSILILTRSADGAEGLLSMRRADREGRGRYVSRTRVRLRCARPCS